MFGQSCIYIYIYIYILAESAHVTFTKQHSYSTGLIDYPRFIFLGSEFDRETRFFFIIFKASFAKNPFPPEQLQEW